MVRRDLKRVGIPYHTDAGVADFHAAGQHTHITELLRNGATLAEAKELARHSDINMTMKYTHIGIADQARAVANLPTPKLNPKQPMGEPPQDSAALHMRCSLGGAEGHSVATTDNAEVARKRKNPRRGKGFGAARREMSSDDKVPKVGLEPTRPCGHWILSPARLPFRHFGKSVMQTQFAKNRTGRQGLIFVRRAGPSRACRAGQGKP